MERPEEAHDDEPGGNGELPTKDAFREDAGPEPPAQGDPPVGPPDELVDRTQALIHEGMSKRNA